MTLDEVVQDLSTSKHMNDVIIASYDIQPPKFAHYNSKKNLNYNFKTASGELADNSIDAGADKIVVLFEGLLLKIKNDVIKLLLNLNIVVSSREEIRKNEEKKQKK